MQADGTGGREMRAGSGRRDWLRRVLGGVAALQIAGSAAPASQVVDRAERSESDASVAELEATRDKLGKAGIGPLNIVRSAHYQAIGDAPEGFMRIMLGDCEQLALDFDRHFRARGFNIHSPDRHLTLVICRDDQSFSRLFPQNLPRRPSGARVAMRPGNYSLKTNVLYVFDWRLVPMTPRSSHHNIQTIAHEGVHQLCFNTGLLTRDADLPRWVVEGLGMYGEARPVMGSADLGRINLERLDNLASIQRRMDWIPLRELVTDDKLLIAGNSDRVLLAYAQSWLLVFYLMKQPDVLPRFRDYLGAISKRKGSEHRIDDVQDHLGDVSNLDRELRRYAVKLQRSL
jgi:hypothetical protein